MSPGPGEPRYHSKFKKNNEIQGHIPFTGGGCNASIGCNARGLILDFKKGFYSHKMFTFQRKANQTMYVNGHSVNIKLNTWLY